MIEEKKEITKERMKERAEVRLKRRMEGCEIRCTKIPAHVDE